MLGKVAGLLWKEDEVNNSQQKCRKEFWVTDTERMTKKKKKPNSGNRAGTWHENKSMTDKTCMTDISPLN